MERKVGSGRWDEARLLIDGCLCEAGKLIFLSCAVVDWWFVVRLGREVEGTVFLDNQIKLKLGFKRYKTAITVGYEAIDAPHSVISTGSSLTLSSCELKLHPMKYPIISHVINVSPKNRSESAASGRPQL